MFCANVGSQTSALVSAWVVDELLYLNFVFVDVTDLKVSQLI